MSKLLPCGQTGAALVTIIAAGVSSGRVSAGSGADLAGLCGNGKRQGLIFYRHAGPMRGETLQARLSELGF